MVPLSGTFFFTLEGSTVRPAGDSGATVCARRYSSMTVKKPLSLRPNTSGK